MTPTADQLRIVRQQAVSRAAEIRRLARDRGRALTPTEAGDVAELSKIVDEINARLTGPSAATGGSMQTTFTRDRRDSMRECMVHGILLRAGHSAADASKGRQYFGLSLFDLARECCET